MSEINPNDQPHEYDDKAIGCCGRCGHERDYAVHRTQYKTKGLLRNKYTVTCNDDRSEDADAKFFVLRYDKSDEWGRKCRDALRRFAESILVDYPLLARELLDSIAEQENQP